MPADRTKLGLREIIAMGVGGMVGGGIFSVLGLAIGAAGHAAPVAFGIGGIIALLTGYSYSRLGLAFRSDGGSFTYLEHAFRHPNVAGVGGWLLLVGYVGTLSLYAYTFGAYGSALFGDSPHAVVTQHLLASLVLLVFLGINLYGVQAARLTEDVIVLIKVLLLALFGAIGLWSVSADRILPVFDRGPAGALMGAALIFVAFEGFELIPNAVNEMKHPERDLRRGIVLSIGVTTLIYVVVSLVAVGNLLPQEIARYKEYALAVAAKPLLGQAGFVLIGLAAVLSTASAINATLFGTARLAMVMAQERALPKVFSHRERARDIPWLSLVAIAGSALLLVNTSSLATISSFASSTFLLVFAAINLSALRLRRRIEAGAAVPLTGLLLASVSWLVLVGYLVQTHPSTLLWIGCSYLVVCCAEFLYGERRILFKYSQAWIWRPHKVTMRAPRSIGDEEADEEEGCSNNLS